MPEGRGRGGALGPRVKRALIRFARLWRTSLQARVVALTLVLGVVTNVILAVFVTTTIRNGLVNDRVDQILSEAAASVRSVQTALDSSTASTGTEVVVLATSNLTSLEGVGAGRRGVALLRATSSQVGMAIPDWYSDNELEVRISDDLRAAVEPRGGQRWQEIAFMRDGREVPGVAVGAPITLPGAGDYELYLVFSLEPEAGTLDFIQGVLLGGSSLLVLMVGVMAWIVTRQVVRPVQEAARIAARLAAGDFDQRLTEGGEDEIAGLAHSFNEMADSLQDQISRMAEMTKLQRQFVSDVAHELRTPLTTIRMAAEMVFQSRENMAPSVARSTVLMADQLDRFEALLAELLEISRFDAGAAVLDVEDADLGVLVGRVVDLATPLAEGKGIEIRVRGMDEPVRADLDPRRIERILRNLIVNAVEHADERGVDITLGLNAKAVAVVVRDYGVGMTLEESIHVFDRFWRADPARARTTGGTGLGLAISLEDAHLHGGRLEAWGRPDRGASFRITLPRRGGMHVTVSPVELVEEAGAPMVADDSQSPSAVPDLSSGYWTDAEES